MKVLTVEIKPGTPSAMEDFGKRIDLAARGLDHEPLTRSLVLEMAPPSLRDNTAWVDRLVKTAAKAFNLDCVHAPLSLASSLARVLVESNYRVRATCAVRGRQGTMVDVRPARGSEVNYGAAVDMGSTTLALALVDLDGPGVIDELILPNPQTEYGADILTRAHLAEKAGGLDILVQCLRNGINGGLEKLCRGRGISTTDLTAAVLSGNTSMTHFVLGLPLRTLIREPYVPVINDPGEVKAKEIGLNLAPEAPVLTLPNRGSYFGGDLMAGVVVSGMARREEPSILVDVGTNAEVVLGQRDWLVGAAGAAGPALEGGVARMGMAARDGVVDRVRIDRVTKEVAYTTIGGASPRGICGSGLIDLLAELFLSGLIDFQGKLTMPPGSPRRVETDEGPAFVVVPGTETENGEPITLSEVEIDILTRSKAGMYTILTTVVKSVGLEFNQLERFFVAGTFGQYIDPAMAVAVGMIPDIPLERFVSLGNSSLKGAILCLLSEAARQEVREVWRKLTYLEMNVNQELMNRFSAARFIPHTDRKRFPSVGSVIK
ncbi:MAG: ASKHA domain-containing protein [Pseudomonadota bacterium]